MAPEALSKSKGTRQQQKKKKENKEKDVESQLVAHVATSSVKCLGAQIPRTRIRNTENSL